MEEYVTDCTRFKPERWLKQSTDSIHPFASLPYGHGPRMCLGRRFADLEMQVFIAKVPNNLICTIFCVHFDDKMYVKNNSLKL